MAPVPPVVLAGLLISICDAWQHADSPVGAFSGQSLAKKRENGRRPSFASSCLTRGMAIDCANTLPSDESAMKTGRAFVTKMLSPHTCGQTALVTRAHSPSPSLGGIRFRLTFWKNWAATTTLELARSLLEMAANCSSVSGTLSTGNKELARERGLVRLRFSLGLSVLCLSFLSVVRLLSASSALPGS